MTSDHRGVSDHHRRTSLEVLHHPLNALVDGAQRVTIQPLQHAAFLGRSVGERIREGMGIADEGISHDSSQILHTAHSIPHPEESKPAKDPAKAASSDHKVETDSSQVGTGGGQRGSLHPQDSSTPTLSQQTRSSSQNEAALDEPGAVEPEHMNSFVYGSKHYNPKNDVILRLETMTSNDVRMVNLFLWLWLLSAFGVLLWQFSEKITDPNAAAGAFKFVDVNVVIGSLCFLAVTSALITTSVRIGYNWKKDWVRRRAQMCAFVSIELVAQWVNLISFIIPNAYARRGECMDIHTRTVTWNAVVRWTMWNTMFTLAVIQAHNSNISTAAMIKKVGNHRIHKLGPMKTVVADMPFWIMHWWKIVLWVLAEGSIAAMAAYVLRRGEEDYPSDPCEREADILQCGIGWGSLGITSIMLGFIVLFFLLYCFFLLRAITQLRANSNAEFKLANTVVRIQFHLRFPAFTFFILSLLLLWYVKPFSCNSTVNTWMGMLPGQMSASCLVIGTSFAATPAKIGRPPLLQVWLQEYAWSEKEKPQKMEVRNSSMALEDREKIEKEPMFCVETMMACLYWSILAYDYGEAVGGDQTTIEEACNMFNPALTHYEMFWEKSLDTKCLLAWNRQNIVLSFRGTASLSNVKADIQAWRVRHLPLRGSYFKQPKVHSGFYQAWRNNGLDQKILAKIKELLSNGSVDLETCRLMITGHSLGGALALLAAYDICAISKSHGFHGRVSCIAFGAPRAGNHHFVRDFNKMVNDCWNVINDQDLVSRRGKFFLFYKRGGHRVIINKMGDLIVRPSPLEASLRSIPFSGSVSHHLLSAYVKSVMAVLVAPFKPNGSKADMLGVLELIRQSDTFQKLLLEEMNITVKNLEDAYMQGGSRELIINYKSWRKRARSETSLAPGSPVQGADPSLRGETSCSYCAPFSLWIRDINPEAEPNEASSQPVSDVNVRDGGVPPNPGQIDR